MSRPDIEANAAFYTGFFDDYFAECDEHLSAARHTLLALENAASAALLEELFRSFHSLKGISAMAGVTAAELLAHQMESYLRALRHGEATFNTHGLDQLMAGVTMLEQIIAARRLEQPPPDITALLAQLAALLPVATTATQAESNGSPPLSPELNHGRIGRRVWRCRFVPTAELAARGANLNITRARLLELGELLNTTPQVAASGGIAFDFVVASYASDEAFAAVAIDGLTCTPDEIEAPPPVPNSAQPQAAAAITAPSHIVRVSLTRLDELMRITGELIISRARLDDIVQRAALTLPVAEARALQETNQSFERSLRDLRTGVTRTRLTPIAEIFDRMPFVVRDLARTSGKQVKLEITGQRTELDKYLVERMMDPLVHLVRNAVSHGLETADERRAQGKPEEGRLNLHAATAGESVLIELSDDGRGVDARRVAERAETLGFLADRAVTDETTLLDLLCTPGFSTREEADRTSGRGVGMDVVRNTVQEMGGTLTLATTVGGGTRFTIQLPLTLAIADALIVQTAGQRFAIPQSAVRELIAVAPDTIKQFEHNELIPYRGGVLPLVRLARLFKLPQAPPTSLQAFVIGTGLGAVGIAVDRIAGQREIVVRAIHDPLIKAPGIAGATELGDGRAVLILDAASLLRLAQNRKTYERTNRDH